MIPRRPPDPNWNDHKAVDRAGIWYAVGIFIAMMLSSVLFSGCTANRFMTGFNQGVKDYSNFQAGKAVSPYANGYLQAVQLFMQRDKILDALQKAIEKIKVVSDQLPKSEPDQVKP